MATSRSKASDRRPRKLQAGDPVVPTEQLSDIEIADAQRASATADETARTDGGEKGGSNRLSYKLLTKEAMEYLHAVATFLTRPDKFGIFEPIARAFGASLPVEQVQRVVRFDPAFTSEIVCKGKDGTCGYTFRPLALVSFRKIGADGTLPTDERLVNESNPEGIEYGGAVLVVKDDPLARFSKSHTLEPRCPKCVAMNQSRVWDAHKYRPKALPKADAEAFVAALNSSRDEGRNRHMTERTLDDRELGIVDENGNRRERKFHSRPNVVAGRPGRQRDPREHNIGNRG